MSRRSDTNANNLNAGSLAQVPADLNVQIKRLESLFTVSKEKLKEITEYFVSELERGLAVEEGDHIVRFGGPKEAPYL
jgi:hexokinase